MCPLVTHELFKQRRYWRDGETRGETRREREREGGGGGKIKRGQGRKREPFFGPVIRGQKISFASFASFASADDSFPMKVTDISPRHQYARLDLPGNTCRREFPFHVRKPELAAALSMIRRGS